jgi:hypothetical protein
MSTARNPKLCRYLTWIILDLAAFTAVADDQYVSDPNVQALAAPAVRGGWDHINIQIWVKKGSAIGDPDTKSRVLLHVNGVSIPAGGTDCTGYSSCEGTKPPKTDEQPVTLYLSKKNPTCVTINWGGMWKTFCK